MRPIDDGGCGWGQFSEFQSAGIETIRWAVVFTLSKTLLFLLTEPIRSLEDGLFGLW
jgi:hypothetical protein